VVAFDKIGGDEMTILNSPDRHTFGSGSQQFDPNPQPEATRLFHERRARLVKEFEAEAKIMGERQAAERAALEARYNSLHLESRDIFAGKRR
jgi:hypothetical protein